MPRTITSLLISFAALAAAACADGPARPTDPSTQPERVISHTVNGKAVRVLYDGRTAAVTLDGRPTLQVRFDGELRHVTAFLANGRTFERTYTRRELEEAARHAPRPSLDVYDAPSDGAGTESGKCVQEWVTYGGATLVATVTCVETGPSPLCAAAVAAAANALESAIKCETRTS